MSNRQTLAAVVGQNARRIRGDYRLEDISSAARAIGLKWDTSRVSALERGEVSPTLPTLLALCLTFSEVTQKPVALTDLASYDGDIQITPELVMSGADLAAALRGQPADQRGTDMESAVLATARQQAGGLAEQRAAQSLGITGGRFASLSCELWGRSFADERDHRAGPGASAQKRGRIARALKDELRQAISHGND